MACCEIRAYGSHKNEQVRELQESQKNRRRGNEKPDVRETWRKMMAVIRKSAPAIARHTLILICGLVLIGGLVAPSAHGQAQGSLGGYMELSTVADGSGSTVFGPGQTVAIDGAMPFVYICQSMYDTNKFPKPNLQIYPAADFYVIPDTGTPLTYGTKLTDVNGAPNTVIGLSDGSFTDEIVAITKPAGNTGAGKYSIVMDACQTGIYDPAGGDMVLGDASEMGFIVEEPSTLAPLNYSPIKTSASQYVDALSGITVNLPLGASVTIPSFCAAYGKLGQDVPGGTALAGWFQTAGAYCQDLIGKYKGLAADPPDPNYKVFAELGDINYASYSASTPLERAARTLANAMADQDAASNAFLNSIQKFQGAQQAGDDEWTMLQLMQMNKDINLLVGSGGSMLRTYAALQALNFALQQDPLGTSPDAQNLEALLPTMEQALGAMLTPMGGFFQPYFDGFGDLQLRPVGLQAYIQVYLGQSYDTNILPGIPQERTLEGLPPIVLPYPTASTGGNYNAAPGTAITLNASQSTDPSGGPLTYAWDLNGNGTFTDATGPKPQYTYSQPGTRTIAVQVTDASGNTNTAYGLANIGDVNSQDIIAMPLQRQIYDIHPDGSYVQLTSGNPGGNIGGLEKLHVDVNGDILVLDEQNGIQRFDSNGNLLSTISPAQVSSLIGIPLQTFSDFAIDGSGNIDLTVFEDFGPGIVSFAPFGSYATDLPGHSKLIRVAPDASWATYLTDLSQPYMSIATVGGVLTESVDPTDSCYGNAGYIRVDPNTGDIIVSNVNNSVGAIGSTSMCSDGVLSINPTTAAITVMIPPTACDGYGCQPQTIPPFGTFGSTDLTFGGSSLHAGVYGGIAPQFQGLFVLDAQGNYIIAPIQVVGLRIGRVANPPQITNNNGTLDIDTFPVSVQAPGEPVLYLNSITVDDGGDYIGVGTDGSGIYSGQVFRVTPDGEIFQVNSTIHPPYSALAVVDVVPQVRAVAPSDMPAPPAITLSNLTVGQNSCPGAAQLSVTVQNTGSTATTLPVQVVFFDGDPGLGMAVGTATTGGVLPAGGSVTLSAPWASPSGGTHNVFALALGANTVNVEFEVCVPSQYAANPLLLSPPSGSNAAGATFTVTAQLVDIFGGGISGAPVTFTVSGANSATGAATTDASGTAQFSYSGKNPGQDTIVATSNNVTSNTATETWTSTLAATTTTVASSLNPATVGQSVTFTATVTGSSPTGTIQFLDGSTSLGTAVLTGGTAAIALSTLSVGTHSITAAYSGDSANATSTSAVLSEVVSPAATPPVVTPPANISIPATQAGGATGSASPALAAYLAGGSAVASSGPAPTRLPPQVGGVLVSNSTLFPVGITTVTFLFEDSSGNIGSATSTVTVTLGTPRITGSIAGVGTDPSSGATYVNIVLTNTGTGSAQNLQIGSLGLRVLSGTGTVAYNSTLSPSIPITIGNLAVGAAVTTRVYLNLSGTVTRIALTESGPVQDVLGTNYTYSTSEALVP
jgi:hypothetical protein